MHIFPSPRPTSFPAQQNVPNIIDELLTAYRTSKQQQKADPAANLILFVRNNLHDYQLEEFLSEQPESVCARLCEEIITILIDENISDQKAWEEICRPLNKLPSTYQLPFLYDVVENYSFLAGKNDNLWQWVWKQGRNISPPEDRSAFLVQLTGNLVATEQYELLNTLMDHEHKLIGYSGRYFSPETHRLGQFEAGVSFWADALKLIIKIPRQDVYSLSLLINIGNLMKKLNIANPAVWKEYAIIVTTKKLPNADEIKKYIDIGCQTIKDRGYWSDVQGESHQSGSIVSLDQTSCDRLISAV